MTDTFEFTLDNPLTEEQWDMITDVDFDHTDRITFHTKHGKEVEFTKVTRCRKCRHWKDELCWVDAVSAFDVNTMLLAMPGDGYCSRGEPREND